MTFEFFKELTRPIVEAVSKYGFDIRYNEYETQHHGSQNHLSLGAKHSVWISKKNNTKILHNIGVKYWERSGLYYGPFSHYVLLSDPKCIDKIITLLHNEESEVGETS